MIYRREVDGLRALAVVAVILFHAGVGPFSGGFAGVDVFFVISGYLITAHTLADLQAGRFSPADFYERRVRRILPALLLVTAISLPLGWLWLMPEDLLGHARSALAVLVFGSNLFFWRESGYFSTAAELKPLLHTWSLAVEEQFYLLFPLLLPLAWRRARRWLAPLLLVICAASLGAAQWGSTRVPSAVFFLLPTRAWELGLGMLVALRLNAVAPGGDLPAGQAASWLAAAGLVMVVASMLLYGPHAPFPGVAALLPAGGTALLLYFARPCTWVAAVLGHRLPVAIGLVSYSAYLWHQPLFALARHRSLEPIGAAQTAVLIVLTLVLAAASWRWVEQPMRDRRIVGRRALALLLGAAMLVIAVAALLLTRVADAQATGEALRLTGEPCNHAQARCYELPGAARRVALWGDSHADVFARPLGEALNARGASLALHIKQSCPSIPGTLRDEVRRLGPRFAGECAAHNAQALDAILQDGVQDLVLASAYQWYLDDLNADGQPILRDPARPGVRPPVFVPLRLAELVDLVRRRGVRVFIVTPHPLLRNADQVRKALHRGIVLAPEFDIAGAAEARRALLSGLTPGAPGVTEIDVGALYCSTGGCRVADGSGRPYLLDGSHLAASTAAHLATRIADLLAPSSAAAEAGGTR